jgi:hypothetical protein
MTVDEIMKKLAKLANAQTSCQVPDAVAYIEKAKQKGRIGKKRKSAIC